MAGLFLRREVFKVHERLVERLGARTVIPMPEPEVEEKLPPVRRTSGVNTGEQVLASMRPGRWYTAGQIAYAVERTTHDIQFQVWRMHKKKLLRKRGSRRLYEYALP